MSALALRALEKAHANAVERRKESVSIGIGAACKLIAEALV